MGIRATGASRNRPGERVPDLGRNMRAQVLGKGLWRRAQSPGEKAVPSRGAQVGRHPRATGRPDGGGCPLSPPRLQHLQEDRDSLHTTTELLQVRVQSLSHILCMQEEELARKVGPWPRPLGPCAREGLVCHSQNLPTSFLP